MASIMLQAIRKRFGRSVTAVDALTLHVEDGEFLSVVGPSGCGKTTILRIIAGLESPTDGRVLMDGRDVTVAAPRERDVALVLQDSTLYPHMTVRANLVFAARVRGASKVEADDRTRTVAAHLSMTDRLAHRPHALSRGELQRAALGRAIVGRPSCLLLDEPLSHLDAALRIELRELLRSIHGQYGLTTVHVTHDQEEACALGDRVAVMYRGRLQQVDEPITLYAQPTNLFVASFTGATRPNVLEGTIEAHDEGVSFITREGDVLCLPGVTSSVAAENAGRDVVLCLRAEALHRTTDVHDSRSAIPCIVERSAYLGGCWEIQARMPMGCMITARINDSRAVTAGDPIRLTFDPGAVQLFRPGPFGERLGTGTLPGR